MGLINQLTIEGHHLVLLVDQKSYSYGDFTIVHPKHRVAATTMYNGSWISAKNISCNHGPTLNTKYTYAYSAQKTPKRSDPLKRKINISAGWWWAELLWKKRRPELQRFANGVNPPKRGGCSSNRTTFPPTTPTTTTPTTTKPHKKLHHKRG